MAQLQYGIQISARETGGFLVERLAEGKTIDRYTTSDLRLGRKRNVEWVQTVNQIVNQPSAGIVIEMPKMPKHEQSMEERLEQAEQLTAELTQMVTTLTKRAVQSLETTPICSYCGTMITDSPSNHGPGLCVKDAPIKAPRKLIEYPRRASKKPTKDVNLLIASVPGVSLKEPTVITADFAKIEERILAGLAGPVTLTLPACPTGRLNKSQPEMQLLPASKEEQK